MHELIQASAGETSAINPAAVAQLPAAKPHKKVKTAKKHKTRPPAAEKLSAGALAQLLAKVILRISHTHG